MKLRDLPQGAGFRIAGLEDQGLFELLRKGSMGALVRPAKKVRRRFETRDGERVDFNRPARAFVISELTEVSACEANR